MASLKNERGYVIEVQGFASGRDKPPCRLAAMAESVVRYLVENHEIPVYRIYVHGHGQRSGPGHRRCRHQS